MPTIHTWNTCLWFIEHWEISVFLSSEKNNDEWLSYYNQSSWWVNRYIYLILYGILKEKVCMVIYIYVRLHIIDEWESRNLTHHKVSTLKSKTNEKGTNDFYLNHVS